MLSDTIREYRGVYDAIDTDFITELVNLARFRRRWMIQEVALAKSATLVYEASTLS